jgi:hypothetical protein
VVFLLWVALWAALVALGRDPINRTTQRCGILLDLAALWGGLLLLVWPWRVARWSVAGVSIVLGVLLLLNGTAVDTDALRTEYVRSMLAYEGVPYMWGGYSKRAIDCSGLVERGLVDADIRVGLSTLRPQLLRAAADLWWHRASADALRDGYHQLTTRIRRTDQLGALGAVDLRVGDLMVPDNGEHTMAYIGDDTWIEADPVRGQVVRVRSSDGTFWFKHPAIILRWTILVSPPPPPRGTLQ